MRRDAMVIQRQILTIYVCKYVHTHMQTRSFFLDRAPRFFYELKANRNISVKHNPRYLIH